MLDRKIKGLPATEVSIDNEYGAYEAVSHLIKLGHQRIGIINGAPQTTVGEDRFRGYKKALEGKGLPLDSFLIKYGDSRMEKAKKATEEFIKMKNHPTALFCGQ